MGSYIMYLGKNRFSLSRPPTNLSKKAKKRIYYLQRRATYQSQLIAERKIEKMTVRIKNNNKKTGCLL